MLYKPNHTHPYITLVYVATQASDNSQNGFVIREKMVTSGSSFLFYSALALHVAGFIAQL